MSCALHKSQKAQLLRAVSDHYGLSDCFVLQELGLWGTHLRWLVKTMDGKTLFLKEKPYYLYDDEFEFHLHLHRHIQRQNGPVVPLLVSTTGEMILSWKGRHFKLLEWVPGRHLSPSQPDDLFELGSLIARFQIGTLGFESEYTGNWSFPRNRSFISPERWSEVLEYTKYIDHALEKLNKQDPSALSWIQDWVRRHGISIKWRDLPQQFIHGDLDYFNCIRGISGDLILVDLDDAHWGYRITDIAYATAIVGGMLILREDVHAHISGDWQWKDVEQLLSGFERYSRLTDVEKSCFNDLLGLNLVRCFVGGLDLDEPSTVTPPENLPDQLDTLAAMLEALELQRH